ncbi:MAG: hypothetical protein M4579_005664, partial [Chaenotheca gracillima]
MGRYQKRGDSREVFGDDQKESLLRQSTHDSSRHSLNDFDLDELDSLSEDEYREINTSQRAKRLKSRRSSYATAYGTKPSSAHVAITKATRRLWGWRKWLFIAGIILSASLMLIGGGGLWIYKSGPKNGQSPPWYPSPPGGTLSSWERSYSKAQKMVERMSLPEKVNVTTGVGWSMGMCVGNTGPAIDTGFPALCLQDGPLGLRFADRISAFPAGVTTGATWNRTLMYERGRALGRESRLKGVNVLLGPSMGPLGRMPAGGRNWEGFGPDEKYASVYLVKTLVKARVEMRVQIEDAIKERAVDFEELVTPLDALKDAFDPEKVFLTTFPTNKPPLKIAPAMIKDQDICLVFINSDGGEGYISSGGIRGDRNDLFPQKGGDALVQSVASGCGDGKGETMVVVHAIGPTVLEKWIDMDGVKAVILANLPGEESGNALVDMLLGKVPPSGKLPYTVGKSLEDYGAGGQILYYPNAAIPQQNFTEGLYIDYRHFDKHDISPRYEFGFGLTYTTFNLSSISLDSVKAKTAFPSPRPKSLSPPSYSEEIPPASEAIFPASFRQLKKYVYPYIKSVSDVKPGTYPYPDGYDVEQPPSPAGGGEGGNPSLWDIHAEVKITLKNTGATRGSEVVQLYITFPDDEKIDFPVKVLRQFEKLALDPNESQSVTFQLTRKDLSYWSVGDQNWKMPTQGKFKIR